MNYPVWVVPLLGTGWVVGLIAITHVPLSHFAVGGGLFLPWAERKALREGRRDWMPMLKAHSKFFLILTGVFGVATGVGIWFAIGLASPEGTSTLIHNFVFGWAIEWTFFLVELTTAAVYYYTWDRVSDELHMKIGWLYAASSILTLVIINGILSFMLTPGAAWLSVAGTGNEASKFWYAFFNPTYWPSLGLRVLICGSLAGIWALVTASRIDGYEQPELKASVIRWSSRWLIPAFMLMPVFFAWYIHQVPVEQRGLLVMGISTIGQGVFTQVTRSALITVMSSATIAAVVYFLAYRNPRDFGLGHAVAVLAMAVAATGFTEQAREMLRKPYVIGQHMFSNGIRKTPDVERLNREGYLTNSVWVRPEEKELWAKLDAARVPGAVVPAADPGSQDAQARLTRGELMVRGQCFACHTLDGYRPLRRLLAGRDREAIGNTVKMLYQYEESSPYRKYMPPLVGTEAEVACVVDYLDSLVNVPGAKKGAALAAAPTPVSAPSAGGKTK
ncbi:MAG: cytochrome ubiquinol oxidase subunit I [Candidatus Hydrogenedentes bacterium]|nr:cytochrome ubiquinol oxidase subunit I [Candidatus Hydrogenedentota bacterium]